MIDKNSDRTEEMIETLARVYEDTEEALRVLDLIVEGKVPRESTARYLLTMYRADMYRVTEEFEYAIRILKANK